MTDKCSCVKLQNYFGLVKLLSFCNISRIQIGSNKITTPTRSRHPVFARHCFSKQQPAMYGLVILLQSIGDIIHNAVWHAGETLPHVLEKHKYIIAVNCMLFLSLLKLQQYIAILSKSIMIFWINLWHVGYIAIYIIVHIYLHANEPPKGTGFIYLSPHNVQLKKVFSQSYCFWKTLFPCSACMHSSYIAIYIV